MATNLVISYPHIPWIAQGRSYNFTESTAGNFNSGTAYHDRMNTVTGERSNYYESSTSINTILYNWDLGASTTVAPDHCVLARLDMLIALTAQPINIRVQGSASSSYSSPVTASSGGLTSSDLLGPRSDDYIFTFSLAAKQYWQVEVYPTSGAITHVYSKLYVGAFHDFLEEPDYEIKRIPARESYFYASSGASYLQRIEEPIYRVTFEWRRITDDVVRDFYNNIVRWKHIHGFFLYTKTNHNPLDNKRLIHCRLVEASTYNSGNKADSNTVIATFEEMLG